MSEALVRKKPKKEKLSSQILRERLGAAPKKPIGISRENAKIKKKLRGALENGPKTVPELAQATKLPKQVGLPRYEALRPGSLIWQQEST